MVPYTVQDPCLGNGDAHSEDGFSYLSQPNQDNPLQGWQEPIPQGVLGPNLLTTNTNHPNISGLLTT